MKPSLTQRFTMWALRTRVGGRLILAVAFIPALVFSLLFIAVYSTIYGTLTTLVEMANTAIVHVWAYIRMWKVAGDPMFRKGENA